jgi:hypothetical protein
MRFLLQRSSIDAKLLWSSRSIIKSEKNMKSRKIHATFLLLYFANKMIFGNFFYFFHSEDIDK